MATSGTQLVVAVVVRLRPVVDWKAGWIGRRRGVGLPSCTCGGLVDLVLAYMQQLGLDSFRPGPPNKLSGRAGQTTNMRVRRHPLRVEEVSEVRVGCRSASTQYPVP